MKDESLVAALITDYKTAAISDTTRAMLTYVDQLTRSPASITATDVSALRRAGFSVAVAANGEQGHPALLASRRRAPPRRAALHRV